MTYYMTETTDNGWFIKSEAAHNTGCILTAQHKPLSDAITVALYYPPSQYGQVLENKGEYIDDPTFERQDFIIAKVMWPSIKHEIAHFTDNVSLYGVYDFFYGRYSSADVVMVMGNKVEIYIKDIGAFIQEVKTLNAGHYDVDALLEFLDGSDADSTPPLASAEDTHLNFTIKEITGMSITDQNETTPLISFKPF